MSAIDPQALIQRLRQLDTIKQRMGWVMDADAHRDFCARIDESRAKAIEGLGKIEIPDMSRGDATLASMGADPSLKAAHERAELDQIRQFSAAFQGLDPNALPAPPSKTSRDWKTFGVSSDAAPPASRPLLPPELTEWVFDGASAEAACGATEPAVSDLVRSAMESAQLLWRQLEAKSASDPEKSAALESLQQQLSASLLTWSNWINSNRQGTRPAAKNDRDWGDVLDK